MTVDLDKLFSDIAKLKVGVIGDAMLDTYWWGTVDRISPEGPVPVVTVTKKEQRIGGAGNVALNISCLECEVTLLTVLGNDDEGEILRNLLRQNNIAADLAISSKQRTTSNKIRIIGRNQQMMRLDAEFTNDLDIVDQQNFINQIEKYFETQKPHVIILQDYNKGVLTLPVIKRVIELCRAKDIVCTADPKRRNFFAYIGVTIFKPNLKEVKEALHILSDDVDAKMLSNIHQQLKEKLHHSISLITLADKGIFYEDETSSRIAPSHVRNVADVSGAGDTVIAIASLVYAITKNIQLASEIANIAGGLVCEVVGTAAIDKKQLLEECKILLT